MKLRKMRTTANYKPPNSPMKPRKPGQSIASYRPPQLQLPGSYNAPGRGRVGKQMPPIKKMNK